MSDTPDLLITKQLIDNACRFALVLPIADVEAVLAEIDRTSTVMPLLDPTGYRNVMDTLPGHRDEVAEFLRFRIALERLRAQ